MASAALLVASLPVSAQTVFQYAGGGVWDATSFNWNFQRWQNGNIAAFDNFTDFIAIDDGIVAGGLVFTRSDIWFTGTLTLGGSVTLTTDAASDIGFYGTLAGAAALTKTGAGALTLGTDNTYTGTTTIVAGAVFADDLSVDAGKSSLGNSTSAIVLGDDDQNGTLVYEGGGDTISRGFDVGLGGGDLAFNASGPLTFTGPISTAGVLSLVTTGPVVLNGSLSGTGSFSKSGGGDLTLGGTVSLARLQIAPDAGSTTFITTASITTSEDQLYINAVVLAADTTLTSSSSTGTVVYFGGPLDGAQALTVDAPLTLFAGPVGAITPLTSLTSLRANAVTVVVGGSVTTSGAQSYHTTSVGLDTAFTSTSAGTLTFGLIQANEVALAFNTAGATVLNSYVLAGSVTTDAGGTTRLNGGSVATTGNQTYDDAVTLGALTHLWSDGDSTVTFGSSLDGAFAFTVESDQAVFSGPVGATTPLTSLSVVSSGQSALIGANITTSGAQSYAAGITLGADATLTASTVTLPTVDGGGHALTVNVSTPSSAGPMTNLTGFTKEGAGTFTLTGDNTFTGTTTITAGTLKIASAGALGSAANLHVATGATLDSNGYQLTVTHLDGGGTVDVGSAGLVLRSADATSFRAQLTGAGGLTIEGGGTATLNNGTHTYAGATVISDATLQFAGTAALPAGTTVELLSGGTLGLSNRTATIGRLTGTTGTVLLPGGTLTVNQTAPTSTFEGVIDGAGGNLVKTGGGHLILNGFHTYTGTTTVTAGRLTVNGSLDGAVQVSGTGVFAGNHFVQALTVGAGGTIAPTNGDPTGADVPGYVFVGVTTFAPGGKIDWQINRAVTNGDSNWDLVGTEGLTITATPAAPFVINLLSLTGDNVAGPLTGFDPGQTYTWQLSTSTNGITGFAADKFTFDRSGFDSVNTSVGGTFAVQLGTGGGYADSSLDIIYSAASAIPEPGTYAALAGLAMLAFAAHRRRRRSPAQLTPPAASPHFTPGDGIAGGTQPCRRTPLINSFTLPAFSLVRMFAR